VIIKNIRKNVALQKQQQQFERYVAEAAGSQPIGVT
jgi:hypothetical protein